MTTATEPSKADRIGILAILSVGLIGGVLMAALGAFTAITRVIDPARYPVDLVARIPVATGPGIIDAYGDNIIVRTSALSPGTAWLLAAGDLINALVISVVTLCFAATLWGVAQRRPFHRSLPAAAIAAGSALGIGSLLAQGLGGIGRMMAAGELSAPLGGVVEPGFLFTPVPVVVGLGLIALAYVFRAGARLQRETEGLV